MIKIYDINDKLLMQAEVTSAAKREQEMSKSDYISLSFSAAEKVILPIGAYINYTYKIDKVREVTRKFLLLESYEPTQSDECSWKYTPQFQHPKMILSKTPFFIYTRNSQNVEVKQNVWSFVGTTSALSEKIKDFLNKDLMFGECGWKVIFSNVTANTVNVSFSDNDFISALTAITNAIGDNCEWHIDYDDEIIYIGKVLIGATPVVLEVGKNVGVPSINNSKEGYYNAFSIFGGTRNITQVNSKGENVSSGDIRLQLDEGNGTILIDGKERSYSIDKYSTLDLRADKTKEPLFTKVLDFSQIYPSLNTYVYNVRGRVKYVLDDNNKKIPISYNADGSVKEYKTFTVWYMKLAYPATEKVEGKTIINTTVDDGVTHYWYDFEVTDDLLINGKNIGCSFEPNFNTGALSTPLAGRGSNGEYVGFELIYHKEASSSHTSDDVSDSNFSVLAGDYEIIYQEDNEVIIPTNEAEMLIPRGESKPSLKCNITVLYNIAMADTIYYEDAQNRLLEKAKEEIVRLLSDLNNYEVKSYSDVFLEDNPQLQIGQSITYKDGHGYELATRVLKLSTNIDYDFIQSITIGNQVIKGTITQLKEDVQTIIASGGSSGNGGGYSVSQLRKLIAKYGSDNFISKQFDDIAKGTITWEKVQKFLQGMLVGGGSWTPDAEGRSHLITDYLEVRMKAIFEELVINKTSTIGGKEIISPAGGVVAHKVEEATVTYNNVSQKAYRCYFLAEQEGDAVDNDFAVGDQVRSESFNVRKGTYHKAGNHFYWRLVIGRDEDPVELEGKKYHYIDLSDTDCATASDVPAKGDVLNQCGNTTDVERQNCLIFSAVDTYSPSVSLYHGINSYSFANREYVEYGVNKQNNKAFFNVYGDMYVGDRPTKENGYEGSSYIRYDSSTKQVSVKGKISAKSTVDGKELSQYFKKIGELQNQVDGAIETWFYDGVPTLENAPAISWKTDKDKEIHLGDLYYNNKTGKAYRFAKDSNTYKWTLITDTDIAKALSDARMAQETANGKMKVFSVQPTTPYQVGDIWVNATYPSDGSTYKNEVLRCQTNKAAGSQFAIGDWIKASKYTDDTVANAAKKAAEDAQKAAQTAQTDIKNLGNTVTDNKKEFDNYVTDGYLEPSEIAAMAQDSKRLEDDFAAAQKSYNEVKNAEVLANTKELTDLNTAFATLTSAKTELVTYLSDISKRYNETDTNGKAAIVSAVGTKFTNFQSAYSAFYDKLGLANAYITSKIYGDLQQNITDLAGYKYLKDALGQTTDIDGGLVMTTLLALRDGDGNVQSGINGAIDPNRGKKSIATWWGGQMVDKDYNSGNLTPATSLIRFDGSGYLANGAIWWDVSGKVHADPTSFIISEKNLGAYLIFFEPTWKAGSAGTSVADLVSLKPNAPFSKLGVSGDATFEGAISFHGIKLTYDSTNKAIKIDGNLYATGGITAYGAGASTTGGGGGLNGSVKSYSSALKLTSESLSEIASAYSIKQLSTRITSLEGGSATSISVSGSGNAVTSITKNGTTITVTKGATFLTAHQSLSAYMKTADAKSLFLYHTRENIVTDLDNFNTSGASHIYEMTDVTNTPTDNGWLQVMNWGSADANYGMLLANDYNINGSLYFRHKVAGKWKAWKTLIDSSNIANQSVKYATTAGTAKNPNALSWSGYASGSYDGSAAKSISIPNNTNQLTNGAGFITASASITGNAATATKVNHSLSVFGKSFNGSADVTVADTDLIASISTATANLTDKTEILTSYASNNGFNDSNAKNRIYRRPASAIWGYINSKTISNADKLDNVHLNGIFTALSNTNNGVSMTIGTVAKSLANMQVYSATKLVTARNIALNGDLMGNANFDGSANITINGYMSYCNATVINTNTYPWRRIAKVNELTGNYSDGCILLYISEGFNGGYYGIARVYIRTDNLSTGANASCSIQWISRNGYGLDSLKIAMYKTTGKAYYDVFLKMRSAYASVVIRTLQDQRGGLGKRFTLVNSTETTNAASHTEAYATIEDAATAIHNQAYTSIAQGSDVATVHNADMVDGIHASGLFTNLSNSGNSLSITVGGTNKTLTVGYATKAAQLNTARTLWGQSFDGTGNVNGTLINTNSAGSETIIRCSNTNGQIDLLTSGNRGVYDRTKTRWLIGTNGANSWLDCGNVGIGTNAPAYKLDVSGDARATNFRGALVGNAATATKLQTARTIWGQSFNGTANVSGSITGVNNITMSNNSYLYGKNTGGTAIQLIAMASWNSVDIGRGALTYGYTTQVMGKTVALTASDDSGKNTKSVELSTAKLYSNVNIETEGGLLAHGGVTAYSSSDIRLKQDLRKLDYFGIIKAMGGTFGFAWKKDNTRSIGWIAQHVLCNPHLKDIVETDEKGYYKINYWSPKLIATAFGAIEQVGDEVSRLKARVVFLESEVQRLSGKQGSSNKKRLDNKNINLLN